MTNPILSGTRVIDFGRYIAGPFCAALLSDLGADVIRVDRRGGSEDRHLVTKAPGTDGALYLPNNRNKRSITLNPSTPTGREVLNRLASSADVIVANLPPAARKAMGLEYEQLRAIKADIILTTVNAFGPSGPDVNKTGFDGIGQAMSGAIAISGYPDKPVKSQVSYVDYGTALATAFGTLAALIHRMKTGEGQHVQGSLIGTALAMMNPIILEEQLLGRSRKLTGNRSPIAGPSDVFATSDGWIIAQVIGDPIYKRWIDLIGAQELNGDPRYADDDTRGMNSQSLSQRMSEWCAPLSTAQALQRLENARIPAGPILSPLQTLEQSQFWSAGLFKKVAHPQYGEDLTLVDTPVKLSRHEGAEWKPAPTVGEHTDQVLAELGYDESAIREMHAAGVV